MKIQWLRNGELANTVLFNRSGGGDGNGPPAKIQAGQIEEVHSPSLLDAYSEETDNYGRKLHPLKCYMLHVPRLEDEWDEPTGVAVDATEGEDFRFLREPRGIDTACSGCGEPIRRAAWAKAIKAPGIDPVADTLYRTGHCAKCQRDPRHGSTWRKECARHSQAYEANMARLRRLTALRETIATKATITVTTAIAHHDPAKLLRWLLSDPKSETLQRRGWTIQQARRAIRHLSVSELLSLVIEDLYLNHPSWGDDYSLALKSLARLTGCNLPRLPKA